MQYCKVISNKVETKVLKIKIGHYLLTYLLHSAESLLRSKLVCS